MANGRVGRPSKPYRASWGKDIEGLYRCPDGRWRINATKQTFVEPDEQKAVQRFREWEAKNNPAETITIEGDWKEGTPQAETILSVERPDPKKEEFIETIGYKIPVSVIAPWLTHQLSNRPEYIAKLTGIAAVAQLRHLGLPRASLKLDLIKDTYRTLNPSTDRAKQEALSVFDRFTSHCQAKTLDDLTTEKLLAYKATTEKQCGSAETKKAYYGRVKNIIGFGLKAGLDEQQIRQTLDRCKVLWTPDAPEEHKPKPITREHFHKLLSAGNGNWRSWLLCGLNLCMSIDEVCGLQWKDFNFEEGTFAAIRAKTRRKRIPRAAVLWPETIEALKSIERTGSPYVFVSSHGTRYNRNTRVREFARLRDNAKLPEEITFGHLRDGAFTAASHGTTDERRAKILAGHAAGMSDHYVLRNAKFTEEACEAVYKTYGPFNR